LVDRIFVDVSRRDFDVIVGITDDVSRSKPQDKDIATNSVLYIEHRSAKKNSNQAKALFPFNATQATQNFCIFS